jgi:hypothetical protein
VLRLLVLELALCINLLNVCFFNRGRNRRRRRGGRKYRKVKLRFKANAAGEGQTNTYNTGSHDNTVTMPSATTSAANGGSHGNISY